MRETNQDAVIYKQFEQKGLYFALCAVCDGVGGLEHGEAASSFLAKEAEKWFDSVTEWVDLSQISPGLLFSHLKDAAELWNEGVVELRKEKGIRTGSTMSLLMLVRDRYYVVHVGDSRIYQYNKCLERLTEDASVPRLKNGRVKNYLSNFMGRNEELWFQAREGRLEGSGMFIVCSDGFYHNLTDEDAGELYRECRQSGEVEPQCGKAVKRMLERGERDNISVGVVMVEEKERDQGWIS